jgi:hypothetical protein
VSEIAFFWKTSDTAHDSVRLCEVDFFVNYDLNGLFAKERAGTKRHYLRILILIFGSDTTVEGTRWKLYTQQTARRGRPKSEDGKAKIRRLEYCVFDFRIGFLHYLLPDSIFRLCLY